MHSPFMQTQCKHDALDYSISQKKLFYLHPNQQSQHVIDENVFTLHRTVVSKREEITSKMDSYCVNHLQDPCL